MKKFIKYIAMAAATMFAVSSCTPDFPTVDKGNLPVASELDVEIIVNDETNEVTFTLKNPAMTPMWIFSDEARPDNAADKKKYAVTVNGYTARFRDAGTHSVEVKAYNASGVSEGSLYKEFTLANTYRDPFDASKYFNAISNNASQEWMWASNVNDHFGCGDSIGNPTGWWSCPAGGKDGVGLYDDRMTFTSDGKYLFNPGEDGSLYVNHDVSTLPGTDPSLTEDYAITVEPFESTYAFEQVWNEAGIEEIWLVLEEGKNLSYVPHDEALTNPRYLVVESAVATMKKKLNLVWYTPTGNGGGPIAWKYEFIPAVKVVTPEEMLAGTDGAGKVWVMDSNAQGHLGCGESVENPAGWWSAPANDKANTGLYDDEVTFYPDGKYVYNPGADGKMYINWGVTLIGPNPGVEPDIDIEWPVTESTYVFDGSTITLAPNTPLIYVPSDVVWENPVFHVTEISESNITLVAENPGCYWQIKLRARDFKAPEATIGGVSISEGPADLTIAQNEELEVTGIDLSTMWIDPDFFEMVNPTTLKFLAVDGDYRIQKLEGWLKVVPMSGGAKATYDNGKALWIIGDGGGKPEGQLIGWNTGEAPMPMARISENQYRITLWMKAEGGSIKVFGQSDWGLEWTKAQYGVVTDNGFFNIPGDDGNIHTMEGGPTAGFYTFFFTDNGGILDMEVKKARFGDLTQWDPTSAGNLWTSCNVNSMEYYYAPGWAQIDNPTVEQDGNNYTFLLPAATTDQWQAQVKFLTDMTTSADKNYDFYLKMTSNSDHPGVTVKLTQTGDDNHFYFADRHPLTAEEEFVYKVANMPGKDMTAISLIFDFGGCAADTEIVIKDILFQEHTEIE